MRSVIDFECSPTELELIIKAWRHWNEHMSFDQVTKAMIMAYAKGELVRPEPALAPVAPTPSGGYEP